MPVSQLFVYGSLLSGFRSPAYEYISRYFSLIGPGQVRGRLYDMGDYPAAVPADEDTFIKGELYTIRDEAELPWAMAQLDDYEGVIPEQGEPQLYRRALATVALDNGQMTEAWIYWYNGNVNGRPLIPSGNVLDFLNRK